MWKSNGSKMARVNISDVAREAGVSLGTVSNAINHPERVRPETRRLPSSAWATFPTKARACWPGGPTR